MASRKKPKSSSSSAVAAAAPGLVDVLLARLSRSDLEGVLSRAISSGECPSVEDVKALLPEARKELVVRQATVVMGEVRTGTGFFDVVDTDLLVHILLQLTLKDRLTCAIATCKAWRGLRDAPPLWSNLMLDVSAKAGPSAWSSERLSADSITVTAAGLQKLLAWLPKKENVTTLMLHTGYGTTQGQLLSPDVAKSTLKALPGLTKLQLGGCKITDAVLNVAAKQPFATNLIDFKLDDVATAHEDAALALIGKSARMTRLTLPPKAVNRDTTVTRLSAAWRHARGGDAVPLLKELRFEGFGRPQISMGALRELGNAFPELELFETAAITNIVHYIPPGPKAATLPRLRVLRFHHLVAYYDGHAPSNTLENVLRCILPAVPAMEDFKLRHGARDRTTPFPGVGGALALLPSTLVKLDLGDLNLEPDALEGAVLPNLTDLTLWRCGDHADAIAETLKADKTGLKTEVAARPWDFRVD